MTSLNLETLRKAASVFITESDFQVIQLEYQDYLKANNYADNETNAEKFCEYWIKEQELFNTFTETSDGNVKYYCMEGADDVKLSTEEYLNNMDMTSYHWENLCRSYWKIFREIVDTEKINKELLNNILKEETISHEQIYELQSAMSERCVELVKESISKE